jgi:hypothetical protein
VNRRGMLTYSLASAALMQTGCKSNTTTVVVVNKTGAKVSIVASASTQGKTYKINKKNMSQFHNLWNTEQDWQGMCV